jgi:hypothetical protein
MHLLKLVVDFEEPILALCLALGLITFLVTTALSFIIIMLRLLILATIKW